ncbi:MAG TPA: hypothetical protein VE441_12085, partial [Mycobacterium sp.]|nr:hypothetical protein [Mycobacterium sp.]
MYLHIGEPKSGTTYLQQMLWTNRAALRAEGLFLPGEPMDHWHAAEDLQQVAKASNDPFGPVTGAWNRLAAQARRASHKAVISHELLAAVDAEQAARGVRALGSADVHVILTVRDIATLLPAEWQESIKHGTARSWPDWLSDVIDHESVSANRRDWWFWRVHDTLEILRLWSEVVPREHVHVITLPSRDADQDLLWTRFAQVVGIDASTADPTKARSNVSLGLAETEFLRRLNGTLPDSLPDWFYWRNIKDGLAHEAFAARTATPLARLALPAERDEWARQHAESVIDGLRAADYDVIGELDELLPPELPERRPDPSDATDAELLAASMDAVVHLVMQLADTQGVSLGADAAPHGDKTHGPLGRALIE